MSPNAHLRLLNPHVAASLSNHTACTLPTELSVLQTDDAVRGGVNSFGYAGTIAHAMLRCPASGQVAGKKDPVLPMLTYKHSVFGWLPEMAADGTGTSST